MPTTRPRPAEYAPPSGTYAPSSAPAEPAAPPLAPRPAASASRGRPLTALRAVLAAEPWRSALGATLLCVGAGLAYWSVAPRTYAAQAVVAPASRSSTPRLPASLTGLAGQLGISADQDPTATPAFYGLLASSESIRREVLFAEVPSAASPRPVPVWSALGLERCDTTCLLRGGLPALEKAVSVAVDRQTGTFTVVAILRDPASAAGLVGAYIAAMERYNRQVRRSQARAGREFLEARVDAVDAQLRGDEDQLEGFYEGNSAWQMSPRQRMAEGRLRRRVDARVELLSNLKRQLEASRLDEVNATPLLNVIDGATPPLRKHSPRGLLILVAAAVTGGFGGLARGLLRSRAAD